MGGADTREDIIRRNSKKTFTHHEASVFERYLDDRFGTSIPVNWVDAKTRQPVNFTNSSS